MSLPTFVIAGERRCGTTSLASWIECHPDIYMHPNRDMAYFIEDEIVGKSTWRDGEADADRWEKTHSPRAYAELFLDGDGFKAVGEKSADYLYWKPAHERIAGYLPEAKFIITLRNPADRAWSHYWNEVGKGRETLSFEEALKAEDERCLKSAWARDHLSYIRRGFYDESLSAFFEYIPPERVMVVTVEQSHTSSRKVLEGIYRFLGVNSSLGYELAGTKHNVNWTMISRSWANLPIVNAVGRIYSRVVGKIAEAMAEDIDKRREINKKLGVVFKKPATGISMSEKSREYLKKLYEPHIGALEVLLGRKFSEWR